MLNKKDLVKLSMTSEDYFSGTNDNPTDMIGVVIIPDTNEFVDMSPEDIEDLEQEDPDFEFDSMMLGHSEYHVLVEWANGYRNYYRPSDLELVEQFEGLKFNFEHIQPKVIKWAKEKGILDKGTPLAQADKTLEEAQEIKDGLLKGDRHEVEDGIGDTLVTLIIQAELSGTDLLQCLAKAYDTIAKRKGKMVDGKFVKDE